MGQRVTPDGPWMSGLHLNFGSLSNSLGKARLFNNNDSLLISSLPVSSSPVDADTIFRSKKKLKIFIFYYFYFFMFFCQIMVLWSIYMTVLIYSNFKCGVLIRWLLHFINEFSPKDPIYYQMRFIIFGWPGSARTVYHILYIKYCISYIVNVGHYWWNKTGSLKTVVFQI